MNEIDKYFLMEMHSLVMTASSIVQFMNYLIRLQCPQMVFHSEVTQIFFYWSEVQEPRSHIQTCLFDLIDFQGH